MTTHILFTIGNVTHAFQVSEPMDKLPLDIVQMASLICEKPNVVIKDLYGLFSSLVPISSLREVRSYIAQILDPKSPLRQLAKEFHGKESQIQI